MTSYLIIMKRKHVMQLSKRTQIAALFIPLLGAAYLLIFDTPFIAQVIFVLLCVSWSAWCFISVFRGPDEVEVANVRYALAFASGIGVPLSLAFVLLMIAMPAIQNIISIFASSTRNDLSPATAGFGLGVAFTILILSAVFCSGLAVWWASKR